MSNLRKHAKRHAKKVSIAGKKIHRKLHSDVHPAAAWWAVSVVAMSSFLIIGNAFAEGLPPTGTPPTVLQQNGQMPMQPKHQDPNMMGQGDFHSGQTLGSGKDPVGSDRPCQTNVPCQKINDFWMNGNGEQIKGGQGQQSGQNEKHPVLKNNDIHQPTNGNQQGTTDQQNFKIMQGNFAKRLQEIKTQSANLKKQGIAVPDDIASALSQVDQLSSKINSAQSADDLSGIMSDSTDALQAISDSAPELSSLNQLPSLLKEAKTKLSQANNALASLQKKAKTLKVDVTQALADFKTSIADQQSLLDQAKTDMKDDPQSAVDSLQNDFMPGMDDLQTQQQTIQKQINAAQLASQFAKDVTRAQKRIKTLQSRKVDTTKLQSALDQFSGQLTNLNNLVSSQLVDGDALNQAMTSINKTRQSLNSLLQSATPQRPTEPQSSGQSPSQNPG